MKTLKTILSIRIEENAGVSQKKMCWKIMTILFSRDVNQEATVQISNLRKKLMVSLPQKDLVVLDKVPPMLLTAQMVISTLASIITRCLCTFPSRYGRSFFKQKLLLNSPCASFSLSNSITFDNAPFLN